MLTILLRGLSVVCVAALLAAPTAAQTAPDYPNTYDYDYGYYDDGYYDDDWYYDYYDSYYDDDLYDNEWYYDDYDDYEDVEAAHYDWFGGYDDAGEEGLFDW